LRSESTVVSDLIAGNVDDDDAKGKPLQRVLVLEAAVDRDENVEPILKKRQQSVVLELVPSSLKAVVT